MPTEKVDDALMNIRYGKADAALVDPAIAKKFKAKFPEIKILDVPLDEHDQIRGLGIMIKKNNKQLIEQVQDAISELKQNDTLRTFEQKWDIS
jgi:ABC-type amino acid transport substrate-binding protein